MNLDPSSPANSEQFNFMNSSFRFFFSMLPASASFVIGGCEEKTPVSAFKPKEEAPFALRSQPPAPETAEVAKEEPPSHAPAEAKLDSHIVLALKKSRGQPPFDRPTQLDPDLVIEADGRVLVDLTASVSKELLACIESDGGKIINSFETARAIRALVHLSRMETLASRADIQFIAPAAQATTNAGGAARGANLPP